MRALLLALIAIELFTFKAAVGLECYQCGIYYEEKPFLLGSNPGREGYDEERVPSCNFFNASMPIFRVKCHEDEKGCLKGWITQPPDPALNNGVIRSCTKIRENVCLIQGAGGACSCGYDFCNKSSSINLNLAILIAVIFSIILRN